MTGSLVVSILAQVINLKRAIEIFEVRKRQHLEGSWQFGVWCNALIQTGPIFANFA